MQEKQWCSQQFALFMDTISNKISLEDIKVLLPCLPLCLVKKILNSREISFLTDTCPIAYVVYLTLEKLAAIEESWEWAEVVCWSAEWEHGLNVQIL